VAGRIAGSGARESVYGASRWNAASTAMTPEF
jgi:hypothetical protein